MAEAKCQSLYPDSWLLPSLLDLRTLPVVRAALMQVMVHVYMDSEVYVQGLGDSPHIWAALRWVGELLQELQVRVYEY